MRFFRRRPSSPSFVVAVSRPSSPSSVVAVVRHFTLSSKGRTFEKNQIFAVFQKTRNFPKIQDFWQNECMRFFRRRPSSPSFVVAIVSRRRHPSSPSSVVAVVRRRPSSVISLFRQRDGPLKKIKFSLILKNSQFS